MGRKKKIEEPKKKWYVISSSIYGSLDDVKRQIEEWQEEERLDGDARIFIVEKEIEFQIKEMCVTEEPEEVRGY